MAAPARSEPDDYATTRIRRVNWAEDRKSVSQFFREYRDWLAEHASVSSERSSSLPPGLAMVDRAIAKLPGVYGPPRGEVLLAERDGERVACGVLREWEPNVGQIERIYVRPDHRGPGFGPKLIRALLDRARELGYERIRVDAIPTMIAAIAYYQEMGFRRIPAYWSHPVLGTLFFERDAGEPESTPDLSEVARSPGRRKR